MHRAKDRMKLATYVARSCSAFRVVLGSTVLCKQYAGFLAQGCFHKDKHDFSNQAALQEKPTLPHNVVIRLGE